MDSALLNQLVPVFWLILGITLAVIEGFTVQLTAIWFALGAACAAVGALLGLGWWPQVAVFLGVSAVLLAVTRPLVKKALHVKKQSTNADRVIGQIGVVREAIDNDLEQGRVAVMGLEWAARTKNGAPAEVGQKVKIRAIEGVKLIVEPQDGSSGQE